MKPCPCGSYAINPSHHGRDPKVDLDLCDVCYWRKRAKLVKEAYEIAEDWQIGVGSGVLREIHYVTLKEVWR